MNVQAILKQKGSRVVEVQPTATVLAIAAILTREGIGAVLVRDMTGQIVGLLSERDVVRGIAQQGEAVLRLPVSQLMTRDIVYCAPQDSINSVMQLMTQHRFRHLPVLDRQQLVGIISIGDVVKQRIAETEQEAEALKAYIATG